MNNYLLRSKTKTSTKMEKLIHESEASKDTIMVDELEDRESTMQEFDTSNDTIVLNSSDMESQEQLNLTLVESNESLGEDFVGFLDQNDRNCNKPELQEVDDSNLKISNDQVNNSNNDAQQNIEDSIAQSSDSLYNVNSKMDILMKFLEEQNKSIKNEFKKQDEAKNEIKNEIKSEINSVKNEINGLNQKLNRQNDKFDEKFNEIKAQFQTINQKVECQDKKIEKVRSELDKKITKQESRLDQYCMKNNKEIEEMQVKTKKLEVQVGQVTETMNKNTSQLKDEINNINEEMENVRASVHQQSAMQINLEDRITKNLNILEVRQNEEAVKVCTLQLNVEKNSETVDKLQKKISSQVNFVPQVNNCFPSDKYEFQMSIDRRNPMNFINSLTEYLSRNHITEWGKIKSILDNNLNKTYQQQEWWDFVKTDIDSFESFKNKFISKMWSQDIQKKARQELQFGKYVIGSKLTLSEYFISKFNICKNLIPAIDKDTIFEMLKNHYNENIITAAIVRNVKNAEEFIKVLDAFSLLDEYRVNKNQNNQENQDKNQSNDNRRFDQVGRNNFDNRRNNNNFQRSGYQQRQEDRRQSNNSNMNQMNQNMNQPGNFHPRNPMMFPQQFNYPPPGYGASQRNTSQSTNSNKHPLN